MRVLLFGHRIPPATADPHRARRASGPMLSCGFGRLSGFMSSPCQGPKALQGLQKENRGMHVC